MMSIMDQHTLRQFDRGLKTLTERLLFMAGLVETHLNDAMTALAVQDRASAERLATPAKEEGSFGKVAPA